MKDIWRQTRYVTSSAGQPFPLLKGPRADVLVEMAVCGRSNAGKSSLLNDLCEQHELARVSKTPGKTQLIHFFSVSDHFIIVDLPGYGFAKVPPEVKKMWGKTMEHYFSTRESLTLLLLLIDIRRMPSDEDMQMVQWAKYHRKKLILVLTKIDKVSSHECKKNTLEILKYLQEPTLEVVHYSVTAKTGRKELRSHILKELS